MAKYKISKILGLFRKFGGWRLVKAYVRLGIIGTVCKECLEGLLKGKSADGIYYAYQPKIINALQNQYKAIMREKLLGYEKARLSHERSNIVWFCWFQGLENAPMIVRVCYDSLKHNLPDKEIRIIDEGNRKQYVSLPDHIERKWVKGQMPPAQFSDLLRLELLIKYGGSWIDSTVLCTGLNDLKVQEFKKYLDADLFFFQFKNNENAAFAGISNWFITSCKNNPLLMTLRDMLYAYWKDYDCVLEYFIFHRFFDMIAVERPNEVSKMPYAYSPKSLALGHNWGKVFKQETWDKLVSEVAFHKVAYQLSESIVQEKNNYYNHIIGEYGVTLM